MMEKKRILGIATATAAIAGLICLCLWFVASPTGACYYTQIDNTKLEQKNTDGGVIALDGSMPFSYTLISYNEKGQDKDITFGTSRELREDAFIRLTVSPIRGVISWEEVSYDELPAAVQAQYDVAK